MAIFTKVNGTTQPSFAIDVANGSIAGTANVAAQGPVQIQGPKLDFFTLTANAALTNAGNVNGYLNNVLTSIQQLGTIALYQAGATQGTISLAIYPSGAYTTATLVAAAQAANATGGLNIGVPTANVSATASFTNL
jgi:hypothetical protein